uniref:hypothetical protein n=1 Tax=Armatimonas sp. TaxID=1872638 RepID=UPI00286D1484
MTQHCLFELWLEFEHTEPHADNDPTDDFANIAIQLPDGRRYALNVWTFGFMKRARYPWPYEMLEEQVEYLLPPDLFVERLDRPTLERVVESLLRAGELRNAWLCPEGLD